MRLRLLTLLLLVFTFYAQSTQAQEKAIVFGRITDAGGKGLPLVNVSIFGQTSGTTTGNNGSFELKVPANQEFTLIISFIGFKSLKEKILLKPGEKKEVNRSLASVVTELGTIEVKDEKVNRSTNLIRINPKSALAIPSASGSSIESLIKTMPGVTSNNELSTQYSVRGGNYDENLVYVNDIEIYRPFLVRSGQQEGLSFLNPDLVSSIQFSAGGFDAKYGDKQSSVLDIQYKRPVKTAGSVSLSLLGASAHLEGASADTKFSYLVGARYKTNKYLLNSLPTKGDYQPSFTDVQTNLNYTFSQKWEISFLGNYSYNKYSFIPTDRETAFGTLTDAYQFKVYFEGQEKDKFVNYLGATTLSYRPRSNINLRLIASAFQTIEKETFDILGQYYLSRLETNWGSDNFGNPVEALGVGSYLNHARNTLNAVVMNMEHRGSREKENQFLQWGVKYQRENIVDKMSEWNLIDSAGFTLPHPPDSIGYSNPQQQNAQSLQLQDFVRAKNILGTNRLSGFLQNTWTVNSDKSKMSFTAGIRSSYWDLNKQLLISPRASVSVKPNWEKDILFRLALGVYNQAPFYREMRNEQGQLNTSLKAQNSYQIVAGSDWDFQAWDRPFKFVTELYYKYLDNIVPYNIDNLRIQYTAKNNARGYATGIDMRVNGEFVKGTESWASLSIMKTREDIKDDFYYTADGVRHEPGFLPTPTDQRVNLNIFFQDFLPGHPTFKMHLNLVFGSSLTFGPPSTPQYQHTYKMPPYKRVDIGFSKMIIGEETGKTDKKGLAKHINSMWISLEILNLLQVSNTISYYWVSDIQNNQYAIPNYLTPRQVNVKLHMQF